MIKNSKYCLFVYSHSDYNDVWPLTFGQLNKHVDANDVDVYFCVDKLLDFKLDSNIQVLYYEDSLVYSERILNNISKLDYDYVLFLHEDWVITNDYDYDYVDNLVNTMEEDGLLHVRSYRNYGRSNSDSDIFINKKNVKLTNIPRDSTNFVSLQPGMWDMRTFIELVSFGVSIPNVLEAISNDIFKKYHNKFYYESNVDIAENSMLYPHIHTVAYGRWAMCNDSNGVLNSLLEEFNIDKNIRGYLDRKGGIDQSKRSI